jgi:hypothetical protein
MVLVPIRVRTKQSYHYPGKIEKLQIESHQRLEEIVARYPTTGSTTRLYHGAYELPLNSSVGSHNLPDHVILECCRSPAMSAALSAVLKDFNKIKELPPASRNREHLLHILQTPDHIRNNPHHSMWQPDTWNADRLKNRHINVAILKNVLQRADRYQLYDLPQCNDCESLYQAVMSHHVWNGGESARSHQRAAHLFKLKKANSEEPTQNYTLVEEKLRILERIKAEFRDRNMEEEEDPLEEFVRRDHERHATHSFSTNQKRHAAVRSADAYLVGLRPNPNLNPNP